MKFSNALIAVAIITSAFGRESQAGIGEVSKKDPRLEYLINYCMQFQQNGFENLGSMIKEMEASPYPVDDYFLEPECQAKSYSPSVKSPIIHAVADDPNGKEQSLRVVLAYYNKKRKQPQIFTKVLNQQNSLGETFLDYIETLRRRGITSHPDQQAPLKRIIEIACRNDAGYYIYKELNCPQSK